MTAPKIFIIAGEVSGDFIGSRLIAALRKKNPNLEITGIGGPLMCAEGLSSLFPMEELSLMGITEIIPHISHLKKRLDQTVSSIMNNNIDIVITIDAPDFCHRVSKRIKKIQPSIKTIHYVAPSVWAWRAGRAKKIAQHLDHLLVLFPFEPEYFNPHNLATTFVGHPLVETILPDCTDVNANLPLHYQNKDCIVVLPGSRGGEIKTLLPTFAQACALYRAHNPNVFFWIPTFEKFEKNIKSTFENLQLPFHITTSNDEKWQAFQLGKLAIAASGTVSLELAKAKLPAVIAYKVSSLTAIILRLLVKTKFVCLINILLGKAVFPELLQEKCTSQKIFEVMIGMEENTSSLQNDMDQAFSMLQPSNDRSPSEIAAEVVLSLLT